MNNNKRFGVKEYNEAQNFSFNTELTVLVEEATNLLNCAFSVHLRLDSSLSGDVTQQHATSP